MIYMDVLVYIYICIYIYIKMNIDCVPFYI